MWLSTQEARRRLAADDPWDFARRAARDFLAGRTSGQRFLADLHLIGHQGPEGLQDLVELDDEYLFDNDPGAEERFMKDRGMEVLVRRAHELSLAPEGAHTASEFVRLGWCLVAPWTSPSGRPVWSVSHHLNGVEPGPAEWASWYVDLEVAREACRNSSVPETSVVEVAVLEDDAARLLAREPQADWWDLRLLREGIPGSSGSRVLGHEPVGGQDCLLEHSWYCFEHPAQLVVPPHHVDVNEAGLVGDWATAERVVDHCQQDRSLHSEIWVGLRVSLA